MNVRRRALVWLLLPSLFVGGCRVVRPDAAPRRAAIAVSSVGPCCEREIVYDLYDAPHRRGER